MDRGVRLRACLLQAPGTGPQRPLWCAAPPHPDGRLPHRGCWGPQDQLSPPLRLARPQLKSDVLPEATKGCGGGAHVERPWVLGWEPGPSRAAAGQQTAPVQPRSLLPSLTAPSGAPPGISTRRTQPLAGTPSPQKSTGRGWRETAAVSPSLQRGAADGGALYRTLKWHEVRLGTFQQGFALKWKESTPSGSTCPGAEPQEPVALRSRALPPSPASPSRPPTSTDT